MACPEHLATRTSLADAGGTGTWADDLLQLDDACLHHALSVRTGRFLFSQSQESMQCSLQIDLLMHACQNLDAQLAPESALICFPSCRDLYFEIACLGCQRVSYTSMPVTSSGMCVTLIWAMAVCIRDQAVTADPPAGMTKEHRPLFRLKHEICQGKVPGRLHC